MGVFSVKKRLLSFKYAIKGLIVIIREEPNALVHSAAAFLVIILGLYFRITPTEWCFVLFAIGMVITAEVFNSAIERLTDITSPGYNEKAGKIKDMAAGGVLFAAIVAAIVGLIIFIPKFI